MDRQVETPQTEWNLPPRHNSLLFYKRWEWLLYACVALHRHRVRPPDWESPRCLVLHAWDTMDLVIIDDTVAYVAQMREYGLRDRYLC